MTLTVDGLGFDYGRNPVLCDVTLPPVRPREVTAVIGPNATGKSTLLHCIAGFRRARGSVALHGRAGARRRGARGGILYLPQELPPRSSITVFGAVLLAHRLSGDVGSRADGEHQVATTLADMSLDMLATRRLSELSGGQLQLVALAQAVVRRPDVLLLDEPTSSLDLRNQLQVLDLVRRIAEQQPAAVLAVIHDLTLAARVADQIVVLNAGRVHSSGTPADVITSSMLAEVYRVKATVHTDDDGVLSVAVTDTV